MAIIHLDVDHVNHQLRLVLEDEVDIGAETTTHLSTEYARILANALLRTADLLDSRRANQPPSN